MRTTALPGLQQQRPVPASSMLAGAIRRVLLAGTRADPPRPLYATAVTVLTATLLFAGPAPARAQSWSGAVSSDWFDPANWGDGAGAVPVPGANVHISTSVPHPAVINGGSVSIGYFWVGRQGSGDLTAINGARLASGDTRVGNDAGAQGIVRIDGPGSHWTVGQGGTVLIGNAGTGSVAVTGGGTVASTGRLLIGREPSGQGSIQVDGADSTWSHVGNLQIGDQGTGTLHVGSGGAFSSDHAILGGAASAVGSATVIGEDSRWTSTDEILVGAAGKGSLAIDGGGSVTSKAGTIGLLAGSQGAVTIDGAGSSWSLDYRDSPITVGGAGIGTLAITDGGSLATRASNSLIGDQAGAQGTVTVSGPGSNWTHTGLSEFRIGNGGTGELLIGAGGTVTNSQASIGQAEGSSGKVAVSGPDSTWTMLNYLNVGNYGTAELLVDGGGTVRAGHSIVANASGSQGAVTVSGAGSLWSVASLSVGNFGNGTLDVTSGGTVVSPLASIASGYDTRGSVSVTGTGSLWDIDGPLSVGDGSHGTLLIADGGAVDIDQDGRIGARPGSVGEVDVDGAGSSWNIGGHLFVGEEGAGSLDITGGGVVSLDPSTSGAAYLAVGSRQGAAGTVRVTGAGSQWSGRDGFFVGAEGAGTLVIEDGGVVEDGLGVLGSAASGVGTAIVRGTGSQWNSSDLLWVGRFGSGELTIGAGGSVSNVDGAIGAEAGGHGLVTVTGAGSSWTSSGDLVVGNEGAGTLRVEAGGLVQSADGGIGREAGSTGEVTLAGTGSRWVVHGDVRDVRLADAAGSTGTLNIGTGGAAGVLDAATVTGGAGTATLNFDHDDADYFFTSDGTAGGPAVLVGGSTAVNLVGTGTTTLLGSHGHVGDTRVEAGKLLVEGALGNTTTTVAGGATLGGSGSIAGDVVIADGGILAPGSSAGTLKVGSLSLSSGSILDYELGQAGVVGGGVNDLIEVTGDLILDGSLRIADIGGFGAGVYRLMNYGGGLTDNGLELGTLPTGADPSDLFLQTAVGGQVNLVNSTGLALTFWDGADGAQHNDGAISGGTGTWDADNGNWTTADGALNGRWADGEFAVFSGAAGDVEVVGTRAVAGLQFMSGYSLAAGAGGALSIANAETVVRVDPGITASIGVDIGGAGGLVKTDTGTLVLSGDNDYLGGTTIRTGTLSVSADANLGAAAGGLVFDGGTLRNTAAFDTGRAVEIDAGGGMFLVDADLGLSGAIVGAGALVKDGAGTLTLGGSNGYTGGTRVLAGTLVGGAGSIRGDLDNDGVVLFDQAVGGTFAGNITGDGTMVKRGAGALHLAGDSALDWTVDAGTLVANGGFDGDVAIAGGALLRVAPSGDGTYAGELSGAGGFQAGSGGTLVLAGDSAAFAGSTVVDAGTLQVDGALGGGVEVAAGAALSGDGALGGAVRVLDGGRVAPGAGVGTLSVGSLWLSEGATLDYGLGQAGLVGGGANDLIEIAGDLTLDGTLAITDVGGFGAGVYRLINYGGTLTDNTLDIGALPDGFDAGDLLVQTAVDGQVNLINSAGAVLGFWDGGTGAAHDGVIQGGDGTWTGAGHSWTDASGTINGGWSTGFAVFGGAAGTVTVDGTQAITGLQFMTDGYLVTGDALALDAAETIVRVDPGVTATVESALTGGGTLVKRDAGTLVLSGVNSYVGGTQLLGGVLAVGSDASLGGAGGALTFDGGRLRLTAAFDSARDIGVGESGGVLDSGAFDTTLEGVFSGDGRFTRTGSGTLTLAGASDAFGGTFALASGELRVDGSLGGTLEIASGALLTGIGTLQDLDNHGTVAAGHSIGMLTLTGDYVHRGDATLLAEIEPGGSSDLLDIAGSATIQGGTVDIIKLPGQYEGGTRYTLVDAAGGVTGTFDTLDQDRPFLDLRLGYDANRVYLDVQRSDVDFNVACGGGTFNQCQVAGALDAIGHDHPIPAGLQTVLAEVTTLTLDQARAGFDRLSGEAHGSLAGIMLEGHALYGQTVSRRIAERREAVGADRLHGGAWVRAYGMGSDLDGDGNAHAADFEQRGLAVGLDAWGGEHWLVGASFNVMDIEADFRPGDRAEADAKNVSLYASFQGQHAYLDVVTSFGWWDNEVSRTIVVGDIDRQARSEYGGHRFATHLEAGWAFDLDGNQQLTPLVSVEHAKLDQERFREAGAGELDLIGGSQDVDRTTVSAGLRWSAAFGSGNWTLQPAAQVRWLHALGDRHAEQTLAFAGAPGVGYRVRGVGWSQDRGLLGVGLQARRGDSLDLFVEVDYQNGGGLESMGAGAGVRWRW